MYSIQGTTITLTRGDSFAAVIGILTPTGEPYTPNEGDVIRFAMKSSFDDSSRVLINKVIPNDTLKLELEPADTKSLSYGTYVYDIQLTKSTGEVDTFITKAKFKLTEEVD